MADHYYSKKPSVSSDRQTVRTSLRGKTFEFTTDAGVFSKEGIDFGSRLLIEAMDIAETDEVLDVGCGYGPIGLTAASLAHRGRVTMVDINERAVELARENARRNGIANADIVQGDLFESMEGKTFTKILTNPPIRAGKQVVHRIFELAFEHLVEGGQLWIVIQKKQGAPSAQAKLESLFGTVEEVTKDKRYRIYRATK
ncbi:class I SAM-dependent methyltransferase [Paenibacillus mesophilus]|uniref:class I SAM-dependent methyltransferase n=1 Tax=Paenibacillus mesophilus TaxID=2582849 RepID=UPI00110E3B15|nr:class I SAM-dependent methyltransferase [Paenibacillus mesophilus]TMV44102.1 class I SAM-dependent methyltransferase [Paenibacillus mesophilus]